MCEHIEEIGKEQRPARRAALRVESAETQDYVSERKGLKGERRRRDGGVELHPECSQ